MSDEINQLIAQASRVAFEAGRRAERHVYDAAIKWIKVDNHIGEHVYLEDLEDTLAELRKEGK